MVALAERLAAPAVEHAEPDEAGLRSPVKWPGRVVAVATALFVVVFTALVFYKHAHLGTRAFDLGIFDQGLWLLSEGETPFVTLRGLHIFGDHSSFLLLPLVPLYWIWADVRVLMVLTVLAMAAGGPLVYAAAKAEGLGKRAAAALGVAFLLLPAVQWQVWDVFHPEALAVPLLLAAYLLAIKHRWAWALVMLALVLLAKEDAALVVIPLALYLGIRFKRRWLAIGGAALGVGALVLNFMVFLPHWSPTGELIYAGRYPEFGSSLGEIAWGVATSPGQVITTALADGGLLYFVAVIVPVLASLVAPEVLLLAVPTYLANTLSIHYYQADVEYHYTAYLIAVIAIAGIVGTRRLLARCGDSRGWRRATIGLVLVAALAGTVIGGPWGLWKRNPWVGHATQSELVAEGVALIPADASVAGDSRIVPHLAHRQSVYMFPNPLVPRDWSAENATRPPRDDFDWLIVRTNLDGMDDGFMLAVDIVIRSGDFRLALENEEVTVYQRIEASAPAPVAGTEEPPLDDVEERSP